MDVVRPTFDILNLYVLPADRYTIHRLLSVTGDKLNRKIKHICRDIYKFKGRNLDQL
jgi:hypothetical protein